MKRIVVGVDGSDGATRALEVAARLAMGLGAELLVVNIAHHHGLSNDALAAFTRAESGSLAELMESLAAQNATRAQDRARELGVPEVAVEIRIGDAAEALLEIADERDAAMIVVGKRGTGRLAGMLLGSVSQKLVSLASRVVIVVP